MTVDSYTWWKKERQKREAEKKKVWRQFIDDAGVSIFYLSV
jgi:hypothetical protein